jgi:replicative DNA helicase
MSNQAIEAESSLIGCLLLDSGMICEVDLIPGQFANHQLGRIYGAIRGMSKAGQAVDIITVADELNRAGGQDWVPILAELAASSVRPDNAKAYADVVKVKHRERIAIQTANQLINDIREFGLSAIDEAVVQLTGLATTAESRVYTMRDSLHLALDLVEKINESGGGIAGIPTGFVDLDAILGGYHDSDLIITGARPAMGKTAFLINQVLNHGVPSGIISTEQPAAQIALRSISIRGSVSSTALRTGNMGAGDYAGMNAAVGILRDAPIYIDETAQPSIADIQRRARRWRHEYGIRVLHVDYVQRIKATDLRAPKHERVEEVVVGLKCLAKELGIPVHALAQVSRGVDSRPDKRPTMSDLKDSGSIEQEADVIGMLYREEVYQPDTMRKGIADYSIEKNRHGPTGTVSLAWRGDYMQFKNFSPQDYRHD